MAEECAGLQLAAAIVGLDEDLEGLPELVMIVVLIASDGGMLNGVIHSFDMSIGLKMVRLGEPVLAADRVETVNAQLSKENWTRNQLKITSSYKYS